MLQKQAEAIEAERMALVAEQHKDLEKLIAAISASVNRDLPLRIEEMVRRELAALGGNMRAVVGPACQAALTEALPRELAGPPLQARPCALSGSSLLPSLLLLLVTGACPLSKIRSRYASNMSFYICLSHYKKYVLWWLN